MDKQDILRQCDALPPDDKFAFLKEHGLTAYDYWVYQGKPAYKRGKPKQANKPGSRRHRTTLANTQNNQCALCQDEMNTQYLNNNKLVCGACNMLLASWRKAHAKGVTTDMLNHF